MLSHLPNNEQTASHAGTCSLRVVSGGQTGVDRAALDVAIALDIPHGGWCPRGRLAEDGRIPDRYQLQETDSADYAVRTEWNVRDSDATLILTCGELSGGTKLTAVLALRYSRPLTVVNLTETTLPTSVLCWLLRHDIRTINVAGPREKTCPGIYELARTFLFPLLRDWKAAYCKGPNLQVPPSETR